MPWHTLSTSIGINRVINTITSQQVKDKGIPDLQEVTGRTKYYLKAIHMIDDYQETIIQTLKPISL